MTIHKILMIEHVFYCDTTLLLNRHAQMRLWDDKYYSIRTTISQHRVHRSLLWQTLRQSSVSTLTTLQALWNPMIFSQYFPQLCGTLPMFGCIHYYECCLPERNAPQTALLLLQKNWYGPKCEVKKKRCSQHVVTTGHFLTFPRHA